MLLQLFYKNENGLWKQGTGLGGLSKLISTHTIVGFSLSVSEGWLLKTVLMLSYNGHTDEDKLYIVLPSSTASDVVYLVLLLDAYGSKFSLP